MNEIKSRARLSDTISWLRFPLIFLIIMLHCYSSMKLSGNHVMYFKIIYPFSLWLGETGVPGFFFISGYLFFLSRKGYQQKLRTRFHSLLIPYILWNALLLGLYVLVYIAGYPQNINGKCIANYTIIDYIRAFWDRGSYNKGNFVPILCPFWYIRNLIILSIISPLFYYIIKYIREYFVISISIWWLITPHNAFIPQTILFFSIGAFFSIHNTNPLDLFIKYRNLIIFITIIFAIGDITVHTCYPFPFNLQIHRLAIIFNIPALFLIADYCCQHGFTSKFLTNTAFIVFSVHYPIIVITQNLCITKLGDTTDLIHILLFFLCVIYVTGISLLIYIFLNNYFFNFKKILSGNR